MTGPSTRVLVLVWLGGLLAATAVGLLAVRLVAAQVGDPAVAPLPAVAAASAAPSGPAAARPSAEPAPQQPTPVPPPARPSAPTTATGAARAFSTAAGTLGVQCVGTSLRLVYATPAQGYALDERSVSGSEAEVRFEGGGVRVRVRLSCATGAPQLVDQRTDPDGGGRDDDGGGRDDGGDDD